MSTVLEMAKKLNKEWNDKNLAIFGNIVPSFERFRTGNLGIDLPIGSGCVEGRLIEIIGKYSSGKSTLACTLLKAYMDKYPEKTCVYFDIEHALDLNFMARITGIDLSRLMYVCPSSMAAEDICQAILDIQENSDDLGCIVIDSLPSLVVREVADNELAKDMGMRGSVAKLLHKFLPQMADLVHARGNNFIMINQSREAKLPNGAIQYTQPGGLAPAFYSSLILRLGTRNWTLGDKVDLPASKSEGCDGFRIKFAVEKNKTSDSRIASGFCTYRYDNYEGGEGMDSSFDNIEIAVKYGFIEKINNVTHRIKNLETGDYYLDDEGSELKITGGMPGVRKYFRENPEFSKEYMTSVLNYLSRDNGPAVNLLDQESLEEIKQEIGVDKED